MTYKEEIQRLLSEPQRLKTKRPFTRGYDLNVSPFVESRLNNNSYTEASLPHYAEYPIAQEQYMRELDPNSHDVLYDDNIPSIVVKVNNNEYKEIKFEKTAVPLQKNIKNKKLLHMTGNKMQFELANTDPSEKQMSNYIVFKQYWDLRNQDGMKNKMVDTQLSLGDAGLLYYFDYKGRVKSRILSYKDGYVLCPHNDQNGDRILESVYYTKDNIEYIDSYDDTYMYRYRCDNNTESMDNGWVLEEPVKHGFNEIPLITKRGKVAWDDVQNMITNYEILFNIFNVVQRRQGWGLLYVKGKFKDDAKKIAGSFILNDTSIDGKGDAKFLTPPSPNGMIETLSNLLDAIQIGSSTTFLLPKDVKTGGDLSGITIQLVQSLDIEDALQRVIDWQNVADKMARLFKYGLSVELVNNGINPTAITDFEELNINAKFKVWKPMNEYEYNQMLTILTGAGLLSKETGIQKNTESAPDELARKRREDELDSRRVYNETKLLGNETINVQE